MSGVELDVNGRRIVLGQKPARELRDAAARRAGGSASQRDLSLVLERAIKSGRVVALQHPELRALRELLAAHAADRAFEELRAAVEGAARRP